MAELSLLNSIILHALAVIVIPFTLVAHCVQTPIIVLFAESIGMIELSDKDTHFLSSVSIVSLPDWPYKVDININPNM